MEDEERRLNGLESSESNIESKMTLADLAMREEQEKKNMLPLNQFFRRMSEIAAETLRTLCAELRVTDEVAEIIWGIVRITFS